eukprot:5665345-Ditylum_brightwellii.AAC.1
MVEQNDDEMEIQALIEDLNNLLNKQEKRGNNVTPKNYNTSMLLQEGTQLARSWSGMAQRAQNAMSRAIPIIGTR